MGDIPNGYEHGAAEAAWGKRWDEWGIYRWDPKRPREETFVVDTPPPTVSGSLHMGHIFSYSHQDLIVRYRRMRGLNISYPMGWDDNGLPTERRVQNLLGIRCNPRLPYLPDWKPRRDKKEGEVEEVSRRNFIEACAIITREDESAFESLWRTLGLSLDWSQQYATIDAHSRACSQHSFLDLVKKGYVYNVESPTMWDIDFQTAVAQAEVEDRARQSQFHDIQFGVQGGGDFVIATTRPELLAACIAVVAHPTDVRYQKLFGKTALTPLFLAPVPIVASEHADPAKGSGILMVCTFGDAADVEWWKHSGLPCKQVVGRKGELLPATFGTAPFESTDPARAQAAYDQLKGLFINQARKKTVELLSQPGSAVSGGGAALQGAPRPTEQTVKFYEKGDRPLEFVTTRQWFIKILEFKDQLLAQGRKIQWHPEHFRHRYEHWVQGLNQDWCASRQRYFGVPFPVWYRLDAEGRADREHPLFADPKHLPVDPLSDCPPGFTPAQRDQPKGFTGDPDVMDTWLTSSLSPQISSHWHRDPERHKKLFPMDVRPQSHEIIRTWAFYTIVKAWMHEGQIPWKNVVISGWILDPDRKKMSKSKGNVVTPDALLKEHSADGVRYWAARARLGTDTAFDPGLFKIGRRLTTKVFNASRFVLGQLDRVGAPAQPRVADIQDPLDRAFVANLRGVIDRATASFEQFDYAAALQATEESFWDFCDNYMELVKVRSYVDADSAARRSAVATLTWALRTYLRLLAPFIPYVTEESWSWRFAGEGRDRSVHTTAWPSAAEVPGVEATDSYGAAAEVLAAVRGAKTDGKKSLRWPVATLTVTGPAEARRALEPVLQDVLRSGNVHPGGAQLVDGPAAEGRRFAVLVGLADRDEAAEQAVQPTAQPVAQPPSQPTAQPPSRPSPEPATPTGGPAGFDGVR